MKERRNNQNIIFFIQNKNVRIKATHLKKY